MVKTKTGPNYLVMDGIVVLLSIMLIHGKSSNINKRMCCNTSTCALCVLFLQKFEEQNKNDTSEWATE